jgi:Kdo2-lipid A phosphotransferase
MDLSSVASEIVEKKWKLKILLLCHIIAALLIGTFLWPATRVVWDKLDHNVFQFLNRSLKGHHNWQIFWAMANHRFADWIEDLFFLGFFIAYVRGLRQQLRRRAICQITFCVLFMAASIYLINRVLFRYGVVIYRDSPTLSIESSFRLSEEIPWLDIKDDSYKSFPADHATTALLFAASYIYYSRSWRLGLAAGFYAIFLCIPRLITGAHWLSDVLIGSGCITLITLSWALCTPFSMKCVDLLEKFSTRFASLKKKWMTP